MLNPDDLLLLLATAVVRALQRSQGGGQVLAGYGYAPG